jgi:hypothetical protein
MSIAHVELVQMGDCFTSIVLDLKVTSSVGLYGRVVGAFLDSGWVPIPKGTTTTQFLAQNLPLNLAQPFTALISADGKTFTLAYDASSTMVVTAKTNDAAGLQASVAVGSTSVQITLLSTVNLPDSLVITACVQDKCVDIKPVNGQGVSAVLTGLDSGADVSLSLSEKFTIPIAGILPSAVQTPKISKATEYYDRGPGSVPDLVCDEGQVQRGVECWQKPDDGYNWTTAGGLLVGKICPPGTNDTGITCAYDRGVGKPFDLYCPQPNSVQRGVECWQNPPVGYDWTTAGGLLIGKVCPAGTNDSGVTCYYDRGAGTIPALSCPPDQVQRGVECWQKPPAGYDWTTAGGLLIGKVCPSGDSDSGTTCYHDRGVGSIPPLVCPAGQVKRGVECFDPPPAGNDWTTPGGLLYGKICPADATDSGISCYYDRGVGKIPALTCPADQVQRGVECWQTPPPGYAWTTDGGLLIGKVCAKGDTDSGTTCYHDRGVGSIPPLVCPAGQIQRGVECFDPPPAGNDWTTSGGLLYGKICPADATDSGISCYYDRGVGGIPALTCPADQVQRGVECWQKPPTGYTWTTDGGLLIGKVCPKGDADSGTTCYHDRGVGSIPPLVCPPGQIQRGVECYDPPPAGTDWSTPGGLIYGDICPANTIDNGITCTYDRGAGSIPALTCPAGQIQRGVDCYMNPPPGNSWTTPGGLIYGLDCPSGTYDNGTQCAYDRGVGKLPIKAACPAGTRDTGTDCWLDPLLRGAGNWHQDYCVSHNPFGAGGACTKAGALWYPNCPAGYWPSTVNICSPNNAIPVSLSQRLTCPAGQQMVAGLCYPVPKPGYSCFVTACAQSKNLTGGTRVGTAASVCTDPSKPVMSAGLCYPPTRPSFSCAATICSLGKNLTPGNKRGTTTSVCPAGKVMDAGLCYPPCDPAYNGAATLCSMSKDVKGGTRIGLADSVCTDPAKPLKDAGLCYPPTRPGYTSCAATICSFDKNVTAGNKRGKTSSVCPTGKVMDAGLCYPPCDPAYNGAATLCSMSKDVKGGTRVGLADSVCTDPAKPLKDAGLCYPPTRPGYTSCAATICSFDKNVTAGNKKGTADSVCPDGKVKDAGLCYPPCDPAYNGAATLCSMSKDVKGGTRIGLTDQTCPADKILTEGLCYSACKDGFNGAATLCQFSKDVQGGTRLDVVSERCLDGRVREGGLCYVPPKDGYGCVSTSCAFSKDVKPGKKLGETHQKCGTDQVNDAGLCYAVPRLGFKCVLTTCDNSVDS